METVAAAGDGELDRRYDLTVVGPNRFLRHFTGDADRGRHRRGRGDLLRRRLRATPMLTLTLTNGGKRR